CRRRHMIFAYRPWLRGAGRAFACPQTLTGAAPGFALQRREKEKAVMRIISVVAAVALATSLSLPAAADGWGGWKHGWRHHHHHHGWRHHHHHHRHGGVGVFLDFRPAPRYVYRSSPDV